MRYGLASSLFTGALAAGLCVLASAWEAAAAGPVDCAIPKNLFDYEPKFPKTLAKLDKGEAMTIVVIGGGSTTGRAAGGDDKAWPARFRVALAERFPKARIAVFNKSVARNTARHMVARFDSDVLAHKPNLVIWETGIADAVRATDLDEFREDLQSGIDKLKAHIPEVMLMDMQYSRHSDLIVYFNRYLTILRGTADINDIGMFPRNEIMRGWSEAGIFDFDVKGQDARRRLAVNLYDCIGKGVVEFLVRRDPEGTRQ